MATVKCDQCGQQYDDWAGSTPCCGSTASIIEPHTEIQQYVSDAQERLKEALPVQHDILITKRQILGAIAKHAIRAAPMQLPFELQTTLLNILEEITKVWVPFSLSFPAMWFTPVKLREFLEKHLKSVAEFNNWNLRPSEVRIGLKFDDPRPNSFVSSSDVYEEYRDNDFIDLDALIRNVLNDICDEELIRKHHDGFEQPMLTGQMAAISGTTRRFKYLDVDVSITLTAKKDTPGQVFEDVLEEILVGPIFKIASPDTEFNIEALEGVGAAAGKNVVFTVARNEATELITVGGVLHISLDAQWCQVVGVDKSLDDIISVEIKPFQKYYAIKVQKGVKMHYKKLGNG